MSRFAWYLLSPFDVKVFDTLLIGFWVAAQFLQSFGDDLHNLEGFSQTEQILSLVAITLADV
jgi:hypothetical protein